MNNNDSTQEETEVGNGRSQVLRAAGLVGAAVLLSRILGLVREIVTRSWLGVSTLEATAYDIASRFPESIFIIIAGGAIGSAFIPTFAAYFARDDEKGAWQLFSAIINLLLIVVTVIAGITAIFAPQFVTFFFAENISKEPLLLPLTVRLMRIMLVSAVIFGVSGVFMGALNARQHFLLPALAPSIYNIGIILGALLITPTEMGLAWGTVGGALGHLLIQLPGLRQKRAKYTAVLSLRDSGVQQVLKLMAPRVLGLSFSEINQFIILFLTGSMPLGSLPALKTAFRLLIMPQGVLGQALGIAAFPTLAELAARSAFTEMRQIIADALRIVLFLGLPITVLFATITRPIIVILFERNLFQADDTTLVVQALFFYAFALVALTALEVVARAFYSLNDTLTPVLAGGVQILLMGILSLWLSRSLFPSLGQHPLGGLALGYSLSNILEVGVLLWLLKRRLGGINGRSILDGFWRMAVASGVMWVGITAVIQPLQSVWLQAIVGTLVGGMIYLVISWLLGIQEFRQFMAYGQRLIRR
ncbi:MAG: murein biosynthesis integral membrane protein MurJ [Chloroflexota bacterium]